MTPGATSITIPRVHKYSPASQNAAAVAITPVNGLVVFIETATGLRGLSQINLGVGYPCQSV